MKQLLVVDDEESIRTMLHDILSQEGYGCVLAADAAQARTMLQTLAVDLVICDIKMPGESGLDLARFCLGEYPDTAIITMTGYGNRSIAAEATQLGTYGHFNKPFERDQLLISVDNALRRITLEKEQRRHLEKVEALVRDRTRLLDASLKDLKRAQITLKEREKKYRNILDNIKEGFFRVDMQGRILMINPAAVRMLGHASAKELLGTDVRLFMADPEQMDRIRFELFEKGGTSSSELSYRSRDGKILTGILNARLLYDSQGMPHIAEGTLMDITDRKQMEEKLRKSERNHRVIFENSPLGMILFNDEGVIVDCNDKFSQLMGASRQQLIGFHSSRYAPVDMRNKLLEALKGQQVCYEGSYTSVNGNKTLDLRVIMNPVNPGQSPTEVIATLEDITERRNLEKTLRENEQRFRAIFENAPMGMVIIDCSNELIVDVNRHASELLGAERNDLLGIPGYDFMSAEGEQKNQDRDQCRLVHEDLLMRPDGRHRNLLTTSVPVHLGGKQLRICIFTDVSDKARAKEALLASYRRTKQLVYNIPSILIGVSEAGLVTLWNPVSEKVFGIASQDVRETSFEACDISWDWDRVRDGIRQCRESASSVHFDTISFSRSDGYEGVLEVSLTPLVLDVSGETGFLLMGSDITRRLSLESQLAQARKLEAVGQLAAGIAHEINTPIQYITDNTRFFEESFRDIHGVLDGYKEVLAACTAATSDGIDPALLSGVQTTIEEADLEYLEDEIPVAITNSLEGLARVAEIVRSMKDFAHPGTKEKVLADINRVVESTVTVSRNEWKYVADLQTRLAPDLPMIPCFPGELSQVLLNLITNASHAIGDVLEREDRDKGMIDITTRCDEEWVEIRVRDDGGGIPRTVQPRIFDPFFTTKEVGKGTGQGLNISRGVIVKKHGGEIFFETMEGKGTTFVIRLPRNPSGSDTQRA